MSKHTNGIATPTETSRDDRHPLVVVAIDVADTAWRMFIPTIGSTILGLAIDKHFGTAPWSMIVLMIVGVGFAALLVKRQLQRVKKEKTV